MLEIPQTPTCLPSGHQCWGARTTCSSSAVLDDGASSYVPLSGSPRAPCLRMTGHYMLCTWLDSRAGIGARRRWNAPRGLRPAIDSDGDGGRSRFLHGV